MSSGKVIWRMIDLMLVVLLLVGCGRPTAELTVTPELLTPTSVPPTPTPVPPTPTPVPLGTINGHITSNKTGRALVNAQIILCLLSETEGEEFVCILQAAPTTRSDASGAFQLSEVPAGSYILMHGLPNELVSTAVDWEGVEVTRGEFCTKDPLAGKSMDYVCESLEYAFWEEGGTYIAGTVRTEVEEGILKWMGLQEGAARSNSLGISIMIVDRELAPVVHVQSGETTQIEWQVIGR